MTYLLTIIDRYTRWPEAIPLTKATAESCARALVRNWIARFGRPDDITSDRGSQFTSHLWSHLNKLLGIKPLHTTAYHPQANGMVERLHRQLKASLRARANNPHWMDDLPFVLLGIRTAAKDDATAAAPCEMVYGQNLCLPGQLPGNTPTQQPTPHEFVQRLRTSMDQLQPIPTTYHSPPNTHVPKDLDATGKVYIRRDNHRAPLDRPYDGPYDIVSTNDKYYTLNINGKHQNVTIDRLKTAFYPTSRYGRITKPPERLQAGSASWGGAMWQPPLTTV